MPDFNQKIIYRRPDPEVKGWDALTLECGHESQLPSDCKISLQFCGVCRLNHEAHVREVKRLQQKIATAAGQGGAASSA